jgi:hypothetical protein
MTLFVLLMIGWIDEVIFALYHGRIAVFIFILSCDIGILVSSAGFLDIDTVPETELAH